ncbi:type II secretion system (T2SS) protein F [Actinomadura pelletieri DSM 43383]|uniref:Type II secretion system (T2SS) protein F n=1 Tax=Actinomadura pelletieri DSM 43383 TaxID=1120940 RepID=A0A495QWV0_9ACTN|nr:type II secretion system F family protein [Actinomadura pelletieri]RKS78608.1 type II secretion system (T2SS) protein F [Actinomadura pelletieri DSM 43383]
MTITLVLAAGGLVGLGLFLCVRELFPAPPQLAAAVDRFAPPTRRPAADVVPHGRTAQAGRWLATRITGTALDVRIPRRDLALIGKSTEEYLVQKLAMTGLGLAVPTVLWTLLMPPVPWLVSTGSTVAYAAIMFAAPDIALRSQAKEAREEFKIALIAYLDLIKMARASGAGPGEALETPARVCRGWAFQRIAATVDPAARGTRDPWDELARLADQIGVHELADTAAIAHRAGTQGAAILDSLTAKAASLREQQLAAALARAKSRTETMTLPVALSVLGYLILLGYPAYARITGS